MTEQVLSRASGIDRLLSQGNYREAEVCSRKMVTGSEIQLDEANDLADKQDRRPMVRDSFSTENTSTIYLYKGVRRRDVTGSRVISAKIVDRRGVCGNRALATGVREDQEDHGGGVLYSNLHKHQNAFSISIMAEDEHLVAPLHRSRGQKLRFDHEYHVTLLCGLKVQELHAPPLDLMVLWG